MFGRLAASDSGGRDDIVSRASVVDALTRCGLALTRQQATRVFQLVDEDEGGTLNCKAHGGGRRCQHEGCTKAVAAGGTLH